MFAEITAQDDQERNVNVKVEYDEVSNPSLIELTVMGHIVWLDPDGVDGLIQALEYASGIIDRNS